MPEIKVFFPKNGTVFHSHVVAATGKYKRPERIRGLLSSLNDTTTYAGQLHVMQEKYWALFFGPVEVNREYLLHIFDLLEPEVHTNIKLKVLPSVGAAKTRIIFPAAGEILTDRVVPVIGVTAAPEVTMVKMAHATKADLMPAEPLPIVPVAKSWTATITIPEDYPCPGDAPDYTVHAEDALGAPFPSNSDIKLDQSIFCPDMLKAKARRKKKKDKKKKKSRGK